MRAESSGISLNVKDAAIIKGMLARGDRQHDIAAWFGVNGGRIAEIALGKRFSWVKAEMADLPPPGPCPTWKQAIDAKRALETALSALADAEIAIAKLTGGSQSHPF